MKDLNIKFPVHYSKEWSQIYDANNNLVADVEGWGRLQNLGNPQKEQDKIGTFIAKAMNDKVKEDK